MKTKPIFFMFSFLIISVGANAQPTSFESKFTVETLKSAPVKLVPFPQQVEWGVGAAHFDSLSLMSGMTLPPYTATVLKTILSEASIQLVGQSAKNISFHQNNGLPKEGYTLKVAQKGIQIEASGEAGQFYAIQTLRQLISEKNGRPEIQLCDIEDAPAFPIRGFMLDVGRNFQSIASLKKQLDIMAKYKLNVFQWHLTDRPAWRVESKMYPELNAAKNQRPTRDPGMFYTYNQIRELIHYAKERQIQVIPEIDMPGHSDCFVKATGHKMESPEGMAILENVLNEFFAEIPKKLCPMFDMGSDEVKIPNPKAFMDKMLQVCRDHGREVVIWNPGLPADDMVIRQTWKPGYAEHRGYREIDSWNNYINNGDPFVHISKLFFKPIGQNSDNQILGGILCLWPDVNLDNEADAFTENPVYPSMLTYAWTTWTADIKDASTDYLTMIPQKGTLENRCFSAFEDFLMHHKQTYFKNLPFQYVRQADMEWSLYGPFKTTDGDIAPAGFAGHSKYASKPATGNTVYIRDRFKQGGQFPDAKPGETYYAQTFVFSDKEQEVPAWIGFETPYRANRVYSGIPEKGKWDNNGGTIWVNDKPLPAPKWKHPGWKPSKSSGWGAPEDQEVPWRKEELYWTRPPVKVPLHKGWNKVLIKVPGTNDYQNWMFTFALLNRQGLKISVKPDME